MFIERARLGPDSPSDGYPFTLPAVRHLAKIPFDQVRTKRKANSVTFQWVQSVDAARTRRPRMKPELASRLEHRTNNLHLNLRQER